MFLGQPERLLIRWKGFAENMASALDLADDHHADLTIITASDGKAHRAHRLVLAASSDLVKRLLVDNEDATLVLEATEAEALQDLLSYLYRGQVHLTPRRFAGLASLGKRLQVKGIVEPVLPPVAHHSAGLSLLASAALDGHHRCFDQPASKKRRKPTNDENDPLNGNHCAINLSLRAMDSYEEAVKVPFYPGAAAAVATSPLRIPDPSSLRWKRSMASSAGLNDTSDSDREDTPPLAIDMSAPPPPPSSTSHGGLTPSPSPSSVENPFNVTFCNAVDMDEEDQDLAEDQTEAAEVSVRGGQTLSQSSSEGGGKKWKSRQPKLCVHCDRYFSNQFNLKQHILNMHTVGGDVRCDKCNKSVKNKWYLRRHHVTHHNAPLKK